MRTTLLLFLLAAGCHKEPAKKPQMHASCRPNSALDGLECTVENIGKERSRACVTAREQPPKANPIIAQRVCTRPLAPGEKLSFRPKFDRYESLQKVCAPDGQWICRDEIVEPQALLTDNMPPEPEKK